MKFIIEYYNENKLIIHSGEKEFKTFEDLIEFIRNEYYNYEIDEILHSKIHNYRKVYLNKIN